MTENITNIAHPLRSRLGTSQTSRINRALESSYAPIDGKTLADRLNLISQFSKLVNYYSIERDLGGNEFYKIEDWSIFFNESLPFKLTHFSKIRSSDLKKKFQYLIISAKDNPSAQAIEALLNFIYDTILYPIHSLNTKIDEAELSFAHKLTAIIKSSILQVVKEFIQLHNSSKTFFCIPNKNFNHFGNSPWYLNPKDIYDIDKDIQQVKTGKSAAIRLTADKAQLIFDQLIIGLDQIIDQSADYINESLHPIKESYQQQHAPHLALLFTFLELFKYLQGNINSLGKKHLDFFYTQVLKLTPKAAEADKVHLIFEIANHLNDGYLLKQNLLFKDGKDINKQDIQFRLVDELVIDKAQISQLRTLALYPTYNTSNQKFLEGLYITNKANSLDGLGKKIKDPSTSWPTLGSKFSKLALEDEDGYVKHPNARIGFALASPVLFLQEGTRSVHIQLICKPEPDLDSTICDVSDVNVLNDIINESQNQKLYKLTDADLELCLDSLEPIAKNAITSKLKILPNEEISEDELNQFLESKDAVSCLPFFSETDKSIIKDCLSEYLIETTIPLFKVQLSGADEWINPETTISITNVLIDKTLIFDIHFTLGPEQPAISFYNAEKLKEDFDLKTPYPLVKIELNKDFKLKCSTGEIEDIHCCLKRRNEVTDPFLISIYELFRELILTDANINVKVCGLRDLLVQNEDNIQDVNSIMMPFGPRPKIGSSFIIGSKELFCKNWTEFRLNVEWKDRPVNFVDYYEAYNQVLPDEEEVTNEKFKIDASILENGNWYNHNSNKELFLEKEEYTGCPDIPSDSQFNGYVWSKHLFSAPVYIDKSMSIKELEPLNVASRKGFFKIMLQGSDFKHDKYAFVLAIQMMKISNTANLFKLIEFLAELDDKCEYTKQIEILTDLIKSEVSGNEGDPISEDLVNLVDGTGSGDGSASSKGLETAMDELMDWVCDLPERAKGITKGDPFKLPEEPYTPLLKSISIDYIATATKQDMDIVHLYPFENTSKFEPIEENPTLFPVFDDEGTLFIGMEHIIPGGQLSLLFQLAEATADSENERAKIKWHYLKNNDWSELLPNFDVIDDGTDGLTISGIVKISIPEDISDVGHTILPNNLYWFKISAADNVASIAEVINIHTQAGLAVAKINELNDTNRLNNPLEAGKVSKLVNNDFNIKSIKQIYEGFGGKRPENSGHYYTRVSEHLKHKGRGIMIDDYEKIVLEAFNEIYKVKCISHTMGLPGSMYRRDMEIAPGYVVVAVIPDLTKLKSGNNISPKAPISLLDKIGDHIRKTISPFARLKVMNPRYEKVDVNIDVQLHRGRNTIFYANKLKEDITQFLAPWHLGDSEKLAFGQNLCFSDVVEFVEGRDYINVILNLNLIGPCEQMGNIIKPTTARSILTAGKICVEVLEEKCSR